MEIKDVELATIQKNKLFQGITKEHIPEALHILNAVHKQYEKNEIIFCVGDKFQYAGMVLDGAVELSFSDENFNQINMNHFFTGQMFGESLACANIQHSPVQMMALVKSRILFFNFEKLLSRSVDSNLLVEQLRVNLLHDFARQNVFLNRKVRILGQKKLRDKIKVYLRGLEKKEDGTMKVVFNKSALAEFLGVDRSALSRELKRMQDEEIISVSKDHIQVLDPDFL